jgi:hypothetical protein
MRLTTLLLIQLLLAAAGSPLDAQRAPSHAVGLAVGALHTDDAGFGASVTGSYVLSRGLLVLSLSPVDLGIGFGGAEGYHEESLVGGNEESQCRDRNGVAVSRFRCNASARYGASAQLVALLSPDPDHAFGLGVGYRAFDAPSAYVVAAIDLGTVRDTRLHLRARGGAHFYDLALGATFRLPDAPRPPRPMP